MILYLHGFRSSPRSFKARLLAQHIENLGLAHLWHCPQLPVSPAAAVTMLMQWVESLDGEMHGQLTIAGSSLGGFYATWLAERLGCRALLLNPAIHPERDLNKHLGTQTVYNSDETIDVLPEFLDELRALGVARITMPERYFLIAATGDEVLDWREMAAHYPQARQLIIQGSDHGISEFADYLDVVTDFLLENKHTGK